MSRVDGRVTSEVFDIDVVIPQVQSSAMALALYVQYQALVDTSGSVITQQAYTAQTVDRLRAVHNAIAAIPAGEFNPVDKRDAFQAYLDLLIGAITDPSLGDRGHAAFSQDGNWTVAPLETVDIATEAELADLPAGQISRVSIGGAPEQLYYRGIASEDGSIPDPVQIHPDLSRAPDGTEWIDTTTFVDPEDGLTKVKVPPDTPAPGTWLRLQEAGGSVSYYVVAANGLPNQLNVSDEGLILFAGSFPEEAVTALRDLLRKQEDALLEQSRVQADFMQALVGQLMDLLSAVSNSIQRIRHSAKKIIDEGVGGG